MVITPVTVTDTTIPMPHPSFQTQQTIRPTTPPLLLQTSSTTTTAASATLDTTNPALIDTQPNSVTSTYNTAVSTTTTTTAFRPHTPTPPPHNTHHPVNNGSSTPNKPIMATAAASTDDSDRLRADTLRLWTDIAVLSATQRSQLIDQLTAHQLSTLQAAHHHLTQLHNLLHLTPHTTPTPTTPPPPLSPPLHLFVQWYTRCLFPSSDSKTINHYHLNTPLHIIRRWLHTPLSTAHLAPTSCYNALWTYLGVFIAIASIALLHQYFTLSRYDWPLLYASHGALATIIFTSPHNPVVLPWPAFGGTLVSTIYAVVIQRSLDHSADEWLWLAAALSASASITTMQLLGCSHPPGGALSVLYIVVPDLHVLGYWYILAAEVGVLIMYLVALIVNNIPKLDGRRFPPSWFS